MPRFQLVPERLISFPVVMYKLKAVVKKKKQQRLVVNECNGEQCERGGDLTSGLLELCVRQSEEKLPPLNSITVPSAGEETECMHG